MSERSLSKAAATRLVILQQAFALIYRNGYRATSVDEIIAATRVTKGAFYYHFRNKDEMGLAVINELMYPGMYEAMVRSLLQTEDPLPAIYEMMQNLLLKDPFFDVRYGCPAINMVEEMSPLDETFSKALARLMVQWQEALAESIERGKAAGKVRKQTNALQVARFIMAGYGGIRNLGKVFGQEAYETYLRELKSYLSHLQV